MEVTVSNESRFSTTLLSERTQPVLASPPGLSTRGSISGEAVEGQTLTLVAPRFTRDPTRVEHLWLRCDADGDACGSTGDTAARYELSAADAGHRMRVRSVAFNAAGASEPTDSFPSDVVAQRVLQDPEPEEPPVVEPEPQPDPPTSPSPLPPSAQAPAPFRPPPPVNPCGDPGAPGYHHPAKMRVGRSRVLRDDRRLDVFAPITSRADGEVQVTYQADGRRDTFTAEVTANDGALDQIRFREPITRGQARLGQGIVTIDYKGGAETRPEQVRLRAASQAARLSVEEISLTGDRLSGRGGVTSRARGVVRLRFSYLDLAGQPRLHLAQARIQGDGDWALDDDQVPPQLARCGGYLSILFTGYFERRIRGEMTAYELNAGQTRRP